MTADLVERTLNTCQRTLEATGLDTTDLAEVILVGGMTRMPLVRENVELVFGRAPCQGVNPDEAVAIGAAIQAGVVEGTTDDVLLLDVTPHDLGILVAGGAFDCIIPHNTPVPTSNNRVFVTTRENQTTVRIMVLQQLGETEGYFETLGAFTLTDLRPARAGEVEIDVTFNIDSDGIVGVAACDLETGKEASMTVQGVSGLTPEEVEEMYQRNADEMVARRQDEQVEEVRQTVQRLVGEIRKLASRVQSTALTAEAGPLVAEAVIAVRQAEQSLGQEDPAPVQEALGLLEEARGQLRSVLSDDG